MCLRPRWTDADLADHDANNESDDEYDAIVRSTHGSHGEYAPLTDRFVSLVNLFEEWIHIILIVQTFELTLNFQTFELNRSIIEGSNALTHNPGTPESDATLRETVKVSTRDP